MAKRCKRAARSNSCVDALKHCFATEVLCCVSLLRQLLDFYPRDASFLIGQAVEFVDELVELALEQQPSRFS